MIEHIKDLAERCYRQNIYTFSGFLTMAEQAEILAAERELSFVPFEFFGGTDGCERQMVRFGSEETLGYAEEFPINCIVVSPLIRKFADGLSHRDFLGALMNLGINRDVLGDIIVKDNCGYIFCEGKMSDYIKENLTQIKHTSVKCEIAGKCPENARPQFEGMELVTASERCDAIISKLFNLSRSQSIELFRGKCIFVDGRLMENNSALLKNGAVVSVRGYGKFIFDGMTAGTRKGKIRVTVRKYI